MSLPYVLKLRLSAEDRQALRLAADRVGCTVADLARRRLTAGGQQETLQMLLEQLNARLTAPVSASAPALPDVVERTLLETLLLVRELTAARDPQVLARVAQQLKGRVQS
jgi:hypothetical protein